MKKILHIAPFNTAGVPITLVKAERKLGYESRLITLAKSPFGYDEDICLGLPFIGTGFIHRVKKTVSDKKMTEITAEKTVPDSIPPVWNPSNAAERALFAVRDALWKRMITRQLKESAVDLEQFDIIELDGGMGFLRNCGIIKRLHKSGKIITCLYLGSDLRRRGVIPYIDSVSSMNSTVEFDHQQLHNDIIHIPFPLDLSRFEWKRNFSNDKVIIGHAPSNRDAKGTNIILNALNSLSTRFRIDILLIEGLSHKEALEQKMKCDIFIDQISELGYGINALESLAMGIPTCTSLPDNFSSLYPHHPYIELTGNNAEIQLKTLIKDTEGRKNIAEISRRWAEDKHDHVKVAEAIHLNLTERLNNA